MSWSVAEVRALATTAARGAGAPPAQAARFGEAAALFLQSGRKPEMLDHALDALPDGPILEYPLAIDRALTSPDGHVFLPVGVASLAGLLECYVTALPFPARLVGEDARLCLEADATTPREAREEGRITGCGAFVEKMTALAARTYVPESDTSRRTGAGAALTDND